MQQTFSDNSSTDIRLVCPIRLDDVDPVPYNCAYVPSNQSHDLTALSLSTTVVPVHAHDSSLVSMQWAENNSNSSDIINTNSVFAAPPRVANAKVPVSTPLDSVQYMKSASSAESLHSQSSPNSVIFNQGATSTTAAGCSRVSRPPLNTPATNESVKNVKTVSSTQGLIRSASLRSQGSVQGTGVATRSKRPLSQKQSLSKLIMSPGKNGAVYMVTKIPQMVSFAAAFSNASEGSPTITEKMNHRAMPQPLHNAKLSRLSPRPSTSETRRSAVLAVPASASAIPTMLRSRSMSPLPSLPPSPRAEIQALELSSLYPLSKDSKPFEESTVRVRPRNFSAPHASNSLTRLLGAAQNNTAPATHSVPTKLRPLTVNLSLFGPNKYYNLLRPQSGAEPVSVLSTAATAATARPRSHLIVRASPAAKFGTGPRSQPQPLESSIRVQPASPAKFTTSARPSPAKSMNASMLGKSGSSNSILIHRDKRFRPVTSSSYVPVTSPRVRTVLSYF